MEQALEKLTKTFSGEIKPTRKNEKHSNLKIGKITGFALSISTSPYVVVDIDINKEMSDDRRDKVRSYFEDLINENNIKVVRTGSGGFHLYSLWDNSFKPNKDSFVKAFSFSDDDDVNEFDIDVFVPFDNGKKSRCVVLPGSICKNKNGELGDKYELIKDVNDKDLITFTELRNALYEFVGVEFQFENNVQLKVDEDAIDALIDKIDTENEGSEFVNENEGAEFVDENVNSIMNKKLFEVLYKGFDENIEIHKDCGAKLTVEVSILPIITALNACINDEITNEDVNDAIDYIYEHAKLTPNAKENYYRLIQRNGDKKAKHYGGLFTILKTYNSVYYNSYVLPLLKSGGASPEDFINDRYTFTDFKKDLYKFSTFKEYINNLVKCLAFIDNGKYIIKEKVNNRIKFSVLNKSELNELFNFDGEYKESKIITEEDVEKAKKNHRKALKAGDIILITHKLVFMKELRKPKVQVQFKRFEKVDLIGDDVNVFGLYRPPNPKECYDQIENEPELIDHFLKLLNDQAYDENSRESLKHFINTNAYLLQYRKKSNVFFIKYSSIGNTGKNYIDTAFSKLYEGFTLNGVTEQQINEKHNGGLIGKLYRAYDEFDNSNYQNKRIDNIVKRLTNDKIAGRAMNADTKEETDYSIDVLNTNHPNAYGLLKGDKALLSRLCILRLKERDIRESEFRDYIDVIDNKNFAYSLYTYLMNIDLTDFVRSKSFNRYPLEKTNAIAKEMLEINASQLDEFIDSIYYRFEQKKYKGEEVDVITSEDLKREYNYFMNGNKYKLTASLDSELESKGIHKLKSMKFHGSVLQVYYRKHIERKPEEFDVFDDDDEPTNTFI